MMFGVTRRTIWSWVSSGLIPCYKIGKSTFFSQKDIDCMMARNRYVCHLRLPAMG
jgi:hypothetical protein